MWTDAVVPTKTLRRMLAMVLYRNRLTGTDVLLSVLASPAWHLDAACRGHAEISWFPERLPADSTLARAICSRCPVGVDRRAWARAQGPELIGVWGGLGQSERRQARGPGR